MTSLDKDFSADTMLRLQKPGIDSGRLERRKRKTAAKRGQEPESHAQRLERIEFWRLLRAEIYERDRGRCRACCRVLDIEHGFAVNVMHTHHLIHKSQGGLDVPENLVATCADCHNKHHDELLSITGTPELLFFVLKNRKQIVIKTWESAL